MIIDSYICSNINKRKWGHCFEREWGIEKTGRLKGRRKCCNFILNKGIYFSLERTRFKVPPKAGPHLLGRKSFSVVLQGSETVQPHLWAKSCDHLMLCETENYLHAYLLSHSLIRSTNFDLSLVSST